MKQHIHLDDEIVLQVIIEPQTLYLLFKSFLFFVFLPKGLARKRVILCLKISVSKQTHEKALSFIEPSRNFQFLGRKKSSLLKEQNKTKTLDSNMNRTDSLAL